MLKDEGIQPSQLQDRIILMSMYNDIVYCTRNNKNECCDNATCVAQYAQNFKPRHWFFLGPGDENKWYGSFINKPDGKWNSTAENMMQEFAESGHFVFSCSFPVSRGGLKWKRRKRFDSLQRRIQVCGDGDENLRVSQPAQYLQSSPVLEKRCEGNKCFSELQPQPLTRFSGKTYKARNLRLV